MCVRNGANSLFLHTKDYPSVGQIISLLSQFEVVTVFAVAQDVLPTYQVLQTVQFLLYLVINKQL